MDCRKIIPALLIIMIIVSGCATGRREMVKSSPEGLYQKASQDFQKGRYKPAIENFQRLADEHPLSELAVLARIGIADAHYSSKEYPEAARIYREFLFLYPTSEYVAYAMYQVGLCHFSDLQAVDRDQTETMKAKIQFEALITRFPESKFSFLAQKHLKEANRRLAEREFYVAMFYYNRKNYRGAIGRLETITREYPGVGLDYKVSYYLEQARKNLAIEDMQKAGSSHKNEKNRELGS